MEPAPERLLGAERTRLANQDEEGGLESVVGVVLVAEDPPTDPQDHRPVSLHQDPEGGSAAGSPVAVTAAEAIQELAVSQPAEGPRLEQDADLLEPPHPKFPSPSLATLSRMNPLGTPLGYVAGEGIAPAFLGRLRILSLP